MAEPSESDREWMRVALAAARCGGDADEVPVGAVVVREGRELARAHNAPIGLCDPTAHAEILALRRAALVCGEYRLPGATLYATIEPCPMCYGAALLARVDRLVFGARDAKAGVVGSVVDLSSLRFNHRIETVGGVLESEAAALMRDFFRPRRASERQRRRAEGSIPAPGNSSGSGRS